MSVDEEYDLEKEGRTKRRLIGGVVAAILIGTVVYFVVFAESAPSSPKRKEAQIIEVFIPPPLPTPPPPPPPPPENIPPPPEEEQMVEQEPVAADEPPPEAPSAPDEPSADIGTGLTGGDGNGFGLTSGGRNGNGRGGNIGGGRNASKYGWYASKVQNSISGALRTNTDTRSEDFTIGVKILVDRLGRVNRAQLTSSTGDPNLDRIIQNQILTGLQLPDPPPADMPMPINLRMSAQKL